MPHQLKSTVSLPHHWKLALDHCTSDLRRIVFEACIVDLRLRIALKMSAMANLRSVDLWWDTVVPFRWAPDNLLFVSRKGIRREKGFCVDCNPASCPVANPISLHLFKSLLLQAHWFLLASLCLWRFLVFNCLPIIPIAVSFVSSYWTPLHTSHFCYVFIQITRAPTNLPWSSAQAWFK